MRSIFNMITVTFCSFALVLSLADIATSETSNTKPNQSDGRIGGHAGQTTHSEKRTVEAASSERARVGGQAGKETPLEERKIGYGSVGGKRVGGQAGLEDDPEKPKNNSK